MVLRLGVLLFLCVWAVMPSALLAQDAPGALADQSDARALAGLWEAKLRFGPDIRGQLIIEADGDRWHAEIAGRSAEVHLVGDAVDFQLPDDRGGFRGQFASGRKQIVGHWIQAPTVTSGSRFASPLILVRVGKTARWAGRIDPIEDEFTMYLKVEPAADGSMRAFLKNPERNAGFFMRVASLERDGSVVRLLGGATNAEPAPVLTTGVLSDDVMSIPLRGGTYDFQRVADNAASDFYPRSRPGGGAAYQYRMPTPLDDGWPIASPEDVGMSRAALETCVRMIIGMPIDSLSSMEIHGVLIARHGKLVLEEYFHGENRDKPHDTRSAAKSLTSVLLGAAIQNGAPLSAQSFVYQVMNGGTFASDLDPRKRAVMVEHLLTMSSGLDADDSDPKSPGNEDAIMEQTEEPDFWKLTLGLNMIREPGERAVYASMQPNLVGGVIRTATGRPQVDLFHELVAEPLQIDRYWLPLMQNGEPYMGGGARFLPRDFMKLGQLMLNGGTWGGHRIVTKAWAERSTSPLVEIGSKHKKNYGYLWWITEYPYHGRTISAFFAAGNGGQIVMGIPELDMVIAFYAGNYSDRVLFRTQRHLIPEYVLPAVLEK